LQFRSGLPTNTAHFGPTWNPWTNTNGSLQNPCGA